MVVKWGKKTIKALRKDLNMTQMEFAELIGSRQQTVSEWETGMYAPKNAYSKILVGIADNPKKHRKRA
jgi:DNA-binding transcriptional regulator YiaG